MMDTQEGQSSMLAPCGEEESVHCPLWRQVQQEARLMVRICYEGRGGVILVVAVMNQSQYTGTKLSLLDSCWTMIRSIL